MGAGVLLARADLNIQHQAQIADPEGVQHVAGPCGLARVVAQLGPLLASIQRLDAGVDVQHPGLVQCLAHGVHQRGAHPGGTGRFIHALQRPAQRVLADDFVHAQALRGNRVAAQGGDVGIPAMACQQAQHQGAQHVALVRRVAATVFQRTGRHPAVEHARGRQEFREEDQLAVRRDRRTFVPVHVHAPAQCVHHLRRIDVLIAPRKGLLSFSFGFTQPVSVPNHPIPAYLLDSRGIGRVQLRNLG